MTNVTDGLVKTVMVAMLDALPGLQKQGVVTWDTLNMARSQVLSLCQSATDANDREMLVGLLTRLG